MNNNILNFDTTTFLEDIKITISKHFATDEWLNLLGQELVIASPSSKKNAVFPIVDVGITNNITNTSYSTNKNIEISTDFTVTINVYTKNLKTINKEILAMKITNEISIIFAQNWLLVRTSSGEKPSVIPETTRWLSTYRGNKNNKTKYFHRNT